METTTAYTVTAAAKALGVTPRRIRALCKTYGVEGHLIHNRLRLLSGDDLALLKARRRPRAGNPKLDKQAIDAPKKTAKKRAAKRKTG